MMIELKDNETVIAKPDDVNAILQAVLAAEDEVDRDKEHFWVFQLDARNRIKALELVSLGTLTASLVHPREVFTRAVASRCQAILVAHNHPSGNFTPSHEDELITKQLLEAGKIIEINLLDHIIITTGDYFSMRQNGLI